jgi:hypothetical protein
MDKEIVDYNTSVIYDDTNSIFVADEKGKLGTISRFNLFGRVIEWFKDLKSGWERSKRTDKAITDTLEKILENLKSRSPNSFYIQDNDRLISPFHPISLFYKRLPVHLYKYNHPVDQFSDKIINSSLSSKPRISQIAQQMKEIALPIIESLNDNQKKDLFDKPWNI